MPGKINVYNLGEKGVNVVKSPIHLTDGELRSAQNTIFDPASAEGGIRKRGGMPRFSLSAMAGAVRGIINVPLPAPGQITRTLYLALGTAAANTWATSPDGTTWTGGTTPALAQTITQADDAGLVTYPVQRMATINRRIYYAGNDYVQYPTVGHTAPPVRVFDGTNDYELFRVPYNPAAGSATNTYLITDFCVHDGRLYMSVFDPGGSAPDHAGRVFEFDPDSGIVMQIGSMFGDGSGEIAGGFPFCLCSHNGMLYAGTFGIAGSQPGLIYAIRPGVDTDWTLKHTTAAGAGYIIGMASFQGDLHFGTESSAGSAALWRKLSSAGVATTIDTGSVVTGNAYYAGFKVYDDELYAVFVSRVDSITLLLKYDGSAVTTDRDVDTLDGTRDVGQPFIEGSDLYYPFVASAVGDSDGFLLRKSSGTWTKVLDNANLRGMMGRVDVIPS